MGRVHGVGDSDRCFSMPPLPAAAPTEPVAFTPIPGWGTLPDGTSYGGDATSVTVDAQDRVLVFNRGPVPMVILDRSGQVVDGWGAGEFAAPHAVAIDGAGDLYLVDSGGSYLGEGGHVVEKRTADGEIVFTIGDRGHHPPEESGLPFNGPTDVAIHPRTGELFVTDGYGNGCVHRYAPDGEHIASWGRTGTRPGEFSLPHGIEFVGEDHVVVCDRENYRLQVLTLDGDCVDQWHAHHPSAVRRSPVDGHLYVTELGPLPYRWGLPSLGCRFRVLTDDGAELARFGDEEPGQGPGQFVAPHGIAFDSLGDVYVAEVTKTWLNYVGLPVPEEAPEPLSLRKWSRGGG
jgi:sugar lactone lactonase YvrE